MPSVWTDQRLDTVYEWLETENSVRIADVMRHAKSTFGLNSVPDGSAFRRAFIAKFGVAPLSITSKDTLAKKCDTAEVKCGESISSDFGELKGTVTTKSLNIQTVEQALAAANVDLAVWSPGKYQIKSWEVTGRDEDGVFQTYTNWGITVALVRKTPEVQSLDSLLESIAENAPKPARLPAPKRVKAQRLLELSIVDVHNGLRCSYPVADAKWDMTTSRNVLLDTSAKLLDRAKSFGPYQEIAVPIGHDWMHIDTANGTTTSGTIQPESAEWHEVFLAGERLAIEWVMALRQIAPVRVIIVPGNHDYLSGFSLGRVLYAYFRNDSRVTVDASADPFKWIHWGRNLIGLTHKTKAPVRMAALMANERPNEWAATNWREWHIGDQHRTGNAQPVAMEEQGVAVDFLPSIVPGNEWHRRKTLNHQRRAGTVHIWDKVEGPIARMVCPAVLP